MMVVHEDSETPVEIAVIRKPLMEPKSYVIVKNHVRELINVDKSKSQTEKSPENPEKVEKQKRKSKRKLKNNSSMPVTSVEREDEANTEINIDEHDMQELRAVYMKCKKVMRKIESKYGHLFDLDSEFGPSTHKKLKSNPEESSNDECDCKLNTKIVFDEDGRQSTIEMVSEKHICAKKVKKPPSAVQKRNKSIVIDYTESEINLPDDLKELYSLLQDPDLSKPLRNMIVNKIRMIKQDYVNEIKFNKHALIEKLKTNPDEVLGFKGTNLSTIPGYS